MYLSNTWRVINAQSHEYFALQEEQESAKQMNYHDWKVLKSAEKGWEVLKSAEKCWKVLSSAE